MNSGISVIVPAYNEEKTIKGTLERITEQNYDKFEVIVVDDGSTDSTKDIVEEFEEVRLIKNENNEGLSGSLNKGMEKSRYEILCSLHADCVPKDKNWLKDMCRCLDDDTAVVTCKRAISEERFNHLNTSQKLLGLGVKESQINLDEGCREAELFNGKGDLFRKKAIKDIGGFGSERFFRAGEDIHIKIELEKEGWNFKLAPTYIYHNHGSNQETLRDFFRKKIEYSEGLGANKRIHGSDIKIGFWNEASKSLLYLSIFFMYINLLSIPLIISKILYQTWRQKDVISTPKIALIPAIIFIGDWMSIFGFWKGYISGKQKF